MSPQVKTEGGGMMDKYQDLARELKKLWVMNLNVIPIVITRLCTVTKGLVQGVKDLGIRGRVETIQRKGLLKSIRILGRVLETWGGSLQRDSNGKPSANTSVNNILWLKTMPLKLNIEGPSKQSQ